MARLTQLAVECGPRFAPVRFGFAKVDGKLAVYVPMCEGDGLADITVYDHAKPVNNVDQAVIWSAKAPRKQDAKQGFVILGEAEDFDQVPHPSAAGPFPTNLDVEVHTAAGRFFSGGARTLDSAPDYASGTPLEQMTFEITIDNTTDAQRDYAQLRKEFFDAMGSCQPKSGRVA